MLFLQRLCCLESYGNHRLTFKIQVFISGYEIYEVWQERSTRNPERYSLFYFAQIKNIFAGLHSFISNCGLLPIFHFHKSQTTTGDCLKETISVLYKSKSNVKLTPLNLQEAKNNNNNNNKTDWYKTLN